jgi:hypothetical protein
MALLPVFLIVFVMTAFVLVPVITSWVKRRR